MTEKEKILQKIYELKATVEAMDKVEEFKAVGQWFIVNGHSQLGNGVSKTLSDHFNYFETKEQADSACKEQRRHNMIMNYVLQKQYNFDGEYFPVKDKKSKKWIALCASTEYYRLTKSLTMHKKTAEELSEDLNSGRVSFE
jgi:hypothetical protein